MFNILLSLSLVSLSETKVRLLEPAPPQRELFTTVSQCGLNQVKIVYEKNLQPKRDFVVSITTNKRKFRSEVIDNINYKIKGYDIEKIFVHNCNLADSRKLALMRIVSYPITHQSVEKVVFTYWLHDGYVGTE